MNPQKVRSRGSRAGLMGVGKLLGERLSGGVWREGGSDHC